MATQFQENVGPAEALRPDSAVLPLIDHQVGLMQLVRDVPPEEFKSNLFALAATGKHFGLSVILASWD
jgi:hypothetical protein